MSTNLHHVDYYKSCGPMIIKNSLKKSLIPYISILLLWITASFFISPWSELFDALLWLTAIALILSFLFIVFKIIIENKKDVPNIFIDLSKLPFLIIGSHIVVLISGKTFNPEGGWWILYTLLFFGLPLSVILFTTGKIIKKCKSK